MPETIDLSESRRRVPRLLLFFLGWTAVVVIMAGVLRLQINAHFGWALVNQGVEYYTLALLSIVVWHAAAWLHDRHWPVWRWLTAHIALGVATIVVWQGTSIVFLRFAYGPNFWQTVFADSWLFQLVTILMTYGTLIGVTLYVQSSRREREREIVVREAELALLRAQYQPHFLFNSLNSILALIETDPPRAREMVVRLSDLLQWTLRRIDLDHVALDGEIDLLKAYLDIEKIRFAARLDVAIDVSSEAGTAGVPPLLLQPLVENAIKHGIGPKPAGGRVEVAARVDGTRLRLEVADSGDGIDPAKIEIRGRGLELTRRRLASAYGSDYRLTFDHHPGRFAVLVDVPFAHA